jgi:TctA family transporter
MKLGLVLSQTSMIKSDWDLTLFFMHPISAILGTITVMIWLFPFLAAFLEKAKKNRTS